LLPLAVAGCSSPMSTLNPVADLGWRIGDLFTNFIGWTFFIFLVVEGLLVWVIWSFRDRPGREEPKPVHGHFALEIGWTLIPVMIVIIIAVPTIATIFRTQAAPAPNALVIEVTGRQWWWEVRYPDSGVVTANEIVVPVGRPVTLELKSADVIHSFWVPRVGGKRDLIGGKVNRLSFTVDTPGTYPGQCAEFCGLSHANMRLLLIAESPEAFDRWIQSKREPPAAPASVAETGRAAFMAGGCVACHTIRGLSAGVVGPDLTHFGSRQTIAAGLYTNTPENLRTWIMDPPAMKRGARMPKLPLSDEQISALVSYLGSLK